jgi:hypothetical protein
VTARRQSLQDNQEVLNMALAGHRQRGRAKADVLSRVQDKVNSPVANEPEKESGFTGTCEKRSRLNIITSVAQVTLDLIRVAREGIDLYRKIKIGT